MLANHVGFGVVVFNNDGWLYNLRDRAILTQHFKIIFLFFWHHWPSTSQEAKVKSMIIGQWLKHLPIRSRTLNKINLYCFSVSYTRMIFIYLFLWKKQPSPLHFLRSSLQESPALWASAFHSQRQVLPLHSDLMQAPALLSCFYGCTCGTWRFPG